MSKDLPQPQQSEEVDLGQLFKLIGNAFERFFKFIGSILNKLFLAFVWCVFFIKKHLIKFAIAGALGIGLGFVLEKTGEPVYESHMVVKQNYPSVGENLYATLSYYNDLVNQGDTKTLANALGIDTSEVDVSTILGFDMESVITENQKIKNFDKYRKELDSTLASTIKYKDYLKNEKDYNHQMQQITIWASDRSNLKEVFEKIVKGIEDNQYFKKERYKDSLELKKEEEYLQEALDKSDTLQETYKNILKESIKTNADKGGQVNLTFEGNSEKDKTKEYDLFMNDIKLREKLKENLRKQEEKKEIIEIISSKQDSGSIDNSKTLFGLDLGLKKYYAILFVVITFIVLVGLEFVRYLERFKDKI
ncbi:hypothetical protein [Aestuariivivens marinum]|uniref:hypothetical protein n=1 Tax=Aestuariivivens marinum TaxID=2913555 RepID=UPI001F56E8A6|nr:hypothetical protein [Aestuariivivens marinum]